MFVLNILSNVKSVSFFPQLHLNFVEGDPDQSGRNGGDGKSLSGCYYSHQKTSSQVTVVMLKLMLMRMMLTLFLALMLMLKMILKPICKTPSPLFKQWPSLAGIG